MRVLDLRGLHCPGPLIELSRSVATLNSGETFTVVADQAGFDEEVKAWASKTGNSIVRSESQAALYTGIIKKK